MKRSSSNERKEEVVAASPSPLRYHELVELRIRSNFPTTRARVPLAPDLFQELRHLRRRPHLQRKNVMWDNPSPGSLRQTLSSQTLLYPYDDQYLSALDVGG